MQLKTRRSLSIGFISLGCPKNLVDSEIIADDIMRGGFSLAEAPEKSDIIIINTCAFILDARKEAVEAILGACALKKTGRPILIIVAGCLPQRHQNELPALFPEVDAFVGIDQVRQVSGVIERLLKGERRIISISRRARAVINPPSDRVLFTEAPYAYIRIAEGCNHHCTFCAIPRIRGGYRSRSVASIVSEAETLLNRGIRELNLIAQDVTFYGHDLKDNVSLALLLRRLGRIGGQFWIRLLYGHPDHITDELLAAMGEIPQVCHYLDLPIQHCDGQILRMMGRKGNAVALRKLFRKIRNSLPDIALRTTCLVGFPGETNLHFRRLLRFIQEIEFDHLGVFVYSEEEGTGAAGISPKVNRKIAGERKDILMRAQQVIVGGKLVKSIGKVEEVFVEKKRENSGRVWLARSRFQAPDIDNAVHLKDYGDICVPGMFVKARYIKPRGYDIMAETV